MKKKTPKAQKQPAPPSAKKPQEPVEAGQSDIVLLAVTGMSPAVLTETIWALAHEPQPIIPHRVIAVTTVAGREALHRHLFQPLDRFGGRCAWDTLRESLAAGGIDVEGRLRFGTTADDIRVITALDPATARSVELPDIRTPAHSEAAADYLLEQVRSIVENPDTRLVASIAGGRKTMGALLYACMTLAGRDDDRLTHVLVTPPFETLPEFFFPAQPGGNLPDHSKKQHPPATAHVELADVTFVPLRNLFTRELGQPVGTFRRLVEQCSANVRQSIGTNLKLEIDHAHPRTLINGRLLQLAPREHLVLLFFALRAKRCETVLSAYDEAIVELEAFRRETRANAPKNDWAHWTGSTGLDRCFTDRDITRIMSDIRAKAQRAGGDAAWLKDVLPKRGRASLDVPSGLIHIKG